ncbi:aldo/keto reductase [Polyangium sp. 15x6]|nr:aldo/keto reductase [Polyangium sp. 15x6]MDI3287403.1 aldo/keto reductase [Polyangium sp. 15x6]
MIATKVYGPMRPKDPNSFGLSRKAIFTEIDNSLKRLGTDYIDLYQIHRFDPTTPLEETLEALNDVVRAGKARYIGASSMAAWQFTKMLYTADLHGWTRFISMQSQYNLVYREEEREMLPLCQDQGIGVIPWSPLARGFLAGNRTKNDGETARAKGDKFRATLYYQPEDFATSSRRAKSRIARPRISSLARRARHQLRFPGELAVARDGRRAVQRARHHHQGGRLPGGAVPWAHRRPGCHGRGVRFQSGDRSLRAERRRPPGRGALSPPAGVTAGAVVIRSAPSRSRAPRSDRSSCDDGRSPQPPAWTTWSSSHRCGVRTTLRRTSKPARSAARRPSECLSQRTPRPPALRCETAA